ncbi:hypothetical protein [Tepidibacillus sp. LV47]|uniref:hypothetical protein n=1 Tax=Tepidibacillus sp. LV47 TaxID=3398228 RepID=UPI003AAD6D82
MKPSIIIVREQDEIVAACCVPFEGDFLQELGKASLYFEERKIIQSTGDLYQFLHREYGDCIDLDVVDPRNYSYLFPRLVKDIFRYKVPFRQAMKTLFALKAPAVIFNGQLLLSGKKQIKTENMQDLMKKIKNRP